MKIETMNLWEHIPGDKTEVPEITAYIPDEKTSDAAIVILPGGGYSNRAPHEGEGYAKFFAENGITAFSVKYRVAPAHFPIPLLDARRSVKFARFFANKYCIDKNKIAIMGSSAGGHLAALVSAHRGPIGGEGVDELDEVDYIPDAQILCYPVLDVDGHPGSFYNLLGELSQSHRKVTPKFIADKTTPPAFIWHTETDNCVDVANTLRYGITLHQLGVSYEMHIYPLGGHGLGVGYHPERNIDIPYITSWTDNLIAWLKLRGWLE